MVMRALSNGSNPVHCYMDAAQLEQERGWHRKQSQR